GFEGEGGRSVTGYVNALISALPYVIGYKAEGDLRYIDANKPRALDLIAVDPQLNRIAVENVTLNVIAQEYVSVLKKQENGNYVYESVLRERSAKSEKIVVAAGGLHYALPTTEPGDYVLELRDDQNRILSKLHFSVVGQGATARSLEKNAELEIKLDRKQYNAGDDIAISIVAPYAGSGLITIEREKVYTYSWFQTNTASSIQHIRLPEGFEGSGYVSVAFVRALDSKEVFVSPLSYGVVPFTANVEKRRLKIDIQTAATVKPGDALRIGYKTDRQAKIVIFAVDQGILQVTDSFDATLTIMAVGVSSETTGSSDRDALIRGPFVITPSVPVLSAPGDEFEAGVTVANNVEGSGAGAEIELRAETSAQLSIKGQSTQTLRIAEGREQSATFQFHVNDALGSGEIKFIASRSGTEMHRRATLSV